MLPLDTHRGHGVAVGARPGGLITGLRLGHLAEVGPIPIHLPGHHSHRTRHGRVPPQIHPAFHTRAAQPTGGIGGLGTTTIDGFALEPRNPTGATGGLSCAVTPGAARTSVRVRSKTLRSRLVS